MSLRARKLAVELRCVATQRIQRKSQIAGGLKARLRLLFEAALCDPLQPERHVHCALGEVRRFLFENRIHDLNSRVAVERTASRYHLVENGAETEDIGTMVDRFTAHLLRRHITGSAQHGADRKFGPHW